MYIAHIPFKDKHTGRGQNFINGSLESSSISENRTYL